MAYYNADVGADVLSAAAVAVGDMELVEVDPWSGSGSGCHYEGFVAAHDGYRQEVNDRLVEVYRVGLLVTAMMDGVHRRLVRDP